MMKKLLLIVSVFMFSSAAIKAQDTCTRITVIDTLHYYFNKYYFKTGVSTYSNFPFYKSAAATVTNVTHVGSMFENSDTLLITGIEAYAAKPLTAASPKIPLRMFLCNLNSSNMPIFPPLDSVDTDVNVSHQGKPGIVGGNLRNGSKKVTGHYAILIRNMSVISGDTVYLLRTNSLTHTNVATPAGWTNANKYSDSLHAYVRFNGVFYNTKNFTLAPGFGWGTEYEFMVAPRVQYTVQAAHEMSQNLNDWKDVNNHGDTACARSQVFTFTNRSSYQYTNRYFNLNEFYRKWNLYSSFVAQPQAGGGFSSDSSITWNFEYREIENAPSSDGRIFLPYGSTAPIVSKTALGGCWVNQFRAALRPMSAFGRQNQLICSVNFSICLKFCDDDALNLEKNTLTQVKIAPNPMNDGVTTIKNLKGSNDVKIVNVLGQEIYRKESDASQLQIDLSAYPAGTYIMQITNGDKQTRTMKLVR